MGQNYLDLIMVFPSGGTFQEANFQHNLGSGYIFAYLSFIGFKVKQYITSESHNATTLGRLVQEVFN